MLLRYEQISWLLFWLACKSILATLSTSLRTLYDQYILHETIFYIIIRNFYRKAWSMPIEIH